MKPLPATAEALGLLAASGDERLGARLGWIAELVLDVVPHAGALSVWFVDEELMLAMSATPCGASPTAGRCATGSSLALTIASARRQIAVVTLYAEGAHAFAGRITAVERALGALPNASVLDDDVEFRSRYAAELAPSQLRGRLGIDTVIGLLMVQQGLDVGQAEDWLHDACRSTGLTEVEVANQVLSTHPDPRYPSVQT